MGTEIKTSAEVRSLMLTWLSHTGIPRRKFWKTKSLFGCHRRVFCPSVYKTAWTHWLLGRLWREWPWTRVSRNYLGLWHHGNLLILPRKCCPTVSECYLTKDTKCPFWENNEKKCISWEFPFIQGAILAKQLFRTRKYLELPYLLLNALNNSKTKFN